MVHTTLKRRLRVVRKDFKHCFIKIALLIYRVQKLIITLYLRLQMSQVKQKTSSDLNVAQWSVNLSEPTGAPSWK